MTQVGNVSQELGKEYLGSHESLQQMRQKLDIMCGESNVELLSKVAERIMELEEHTQKLHEDLNN